MMTGARIIAGLVTMLAIVACGPTDSGLGPVVEGEQSVARGDASSAEIRVVMDLSQLVVSGGADDLAQLAELAYTSHETLVPSVATSNEDGRELVVVTQPATDDAGARQRPGDNAWELRLGPDVPVDLDMAIEDVRLEMDLAGVPLTSLSLDNGSGRAVVSLGGDQPQLRAVDIENGSGELWVSMEGHYRDLPSVAIRTESGPLTLVLLGEWQTDLTATVESASGNVTVHVPVGIGVRVEAVSAGGTVTGGEGFRREGDVWVNDAWGVAAVSIVVRASSDSGDIAFRVDR